MNDQNMFIKRFFLNEEHLSLQIYTYMLASKLKFRSIEDLLRSMWNRKVTYGRCEIE